MYGKGLKKGLKSIIYPEISPYALSAIFLYQSTECVNEATIHIKNTTMEQKKMCP